MACTSHSAGPLDQPGHHSTRSSSHYPEALEQLQPLAAGLDHTHHGAVGSLREEPPWTLTVIRLGIKGKLKRTSSPPSPLRVDDRLRPSHAAQPPLPQPDNPTNRETAIVVTV